jgi:hypothetical protein
MAWVNHAYPSSAPVDFVEQDNATMADAFQFDPPPYGLTGATGCTGPQWNFVGQNFRMDIKRRRDDESALLSLTSDAGEIVVDDETNRILHFNVPETTLTGALIPGWYYYDFIMYDGSSPPIRVPLMHGWFRLVHGITGG